MAEDPFGALSFVSVLVSAYFYFASSLRTQWFSNLQKRVFARTWFPYVFLHEENRIRYSEFGPAARFFVISILTDGRPDNGRSDAQDKHPWRNPSALPNHQFYNCNIAIGGLDSRPEVVRLLLGQLQVTPI